MQTQTELAHLSESAAARLRALSAAVFEGRRPPPGAYAFFYQNGNALEKVETCQLLVDRLFEQAARLTQLSKQQESLAHEELSNRGPVPPEGDCLTREERRGAILMRIDFESLYVFGGVLLDQWSLQAGCIGGLRLEGFPFRELVSKLEAGEGGAVQVFWTECREALLWLYHQLRYYRNHFVVHADRPWQRGSSRSVHGREFRLFTPSPPGWLNDADLNQEIMTLLPFAPDHIRDAPDGYWEKARPRALIERIFDNIGNIEMKEDRKRIAALYGKVGGSTPSFQVVAARLFGFIGEGTRILERIAKENLDRIDLGAPHKLSAELEKDWPQISVRADCAALLGLPAAPQAEA